MEIWRLEQNPHLRFPQEFDGPGLGAGSAHGTHLESVFQGTLLPVDRCSIKKGLCDRMGTIWHGV